MYDVFWVQLPQCVLMWASPWCCFSADSAPLWSPHLRAHSQCPVLRHHRLFRAVVDGTLLSRVLPLGRMPWTLRVFWESNIRHVVCIWLRRGRSSDARIGAYACRRVLGGLSSAVVRRAARSVCAQAAGGTLPFSLSGGAGSHGKRSSNSYEAAGHFPE